MKTAEGFEEFVAIVEAGSVSQAARTLEVPRATLSRQLARLERNLGVRLAHRTSRNMTLTRAGELLYARARRILDEAREAAADVAQLDDVPRGVLRVSLPGGDHVWFSQMLGAFLDAYPQVRVEVLVTARFVDLVDEKVDVVLRASISADDDLIGRSILETPVVCAASPDYLDRHGTPQQPEDLREHQCIVGMPKGSRQTWPTRDGQEIEVTGRVASNDLDLHIQAAMMGLGIAMLPEISIRGQLDRGELRVVLREHIGIPSYVRVLYADREYLPAKTRAFIDHMFQWAKDRPFAA